MKIYMTDLASVSIRKKVQSGRKVIKGWTEAMQLMVEGDKWQMYIPSELGYGDGGTGVAWLSELRNTS